MSLEYKNALESINKEIRSLTDIVGEAHEDKILKSCGESVKRAVIQNMPERSESSHVHMRDDVKVKVRSSKDAGKYVSIGGGKETGYKWHFISDGYTDRAGKWHSGNAFMDKALKQSESEIGDILNEAISGGLK